MCTYNGAKFVRQQLDSIAAQTSLPDELVIIDDCSTDDTVGIIRRFAEAAPFAVHLHVNEENVGRAAKGITRNFERAVGLCTGELIVPCDQDDIWMPQKIARMSEILLSDAGIGAVFSDAQLVSETGVPKGVLLSQTTGLNAREQAQLERGDGLPLVMSMTKVYGSSLMFRAALLDKVLPVPPHWWFDAWVACVATVYTRLVFTREELFQYRIHPNQSVSASLQTVSQKVDRWRSSAEEYWKRSEPPLTDLETQLAGENDPRLEPSLRYVRGRKELLQFRAGMPANRLVRWVAILPHTREYFAYFNGWRSLVKDLTA
jgi:glycosyltransferase involved in cell wall biosynthesis